MPDPDAVAAGRVQADRAVAEIRAAQLVRWHHEDHAADADAEVGAGDDLDIVSREPVGGE